MRVSQLDHRKPRVFRYRDGWEAERGGRPSLPSTVLMMVMQGFSTAFLGWWTRSVLRGGSLVGFWPGMVVQGQGETSYDPFSCSVFFFFWRCPSSYLLATR